MNAAARKAPDHNQRPGGGLGLFIVGIPIGVGIVFLCAPGGLINNEDVQRYTKHSAEQAAIVLFCSALCVLGGKLVASVRERAACRRGLLPAWDRTPMLPTDAGKLRDLALAGPAWVRRTYLGRRVVGILDFVAARNTADDLDDQIRCLADNDVMALETSYSLLRFINWAIPILGFLGTVLGITKAISGVTPEALEHSLSGVTDGLAEAFDTTAMGLFLTMVLMLLCFLVEKIEQAILESVDAHVDAELTHRFQRGGPEGTGPLVGVLQQNTQVLLNATQQLVEKQASVWGNVIERSEKQWAQAGAQQQQGMTAAIQQALEHALTRYGQRLAELESQMLQRNQALLDSIGQLAGSLRDAGREQHLAQARLSDAMGLQVETLAKTQAGRQELVKLEQTLAQNLEVLASTGSFDQAVQSLTAAIHLLTTRVGPGSGGATGPRLARPA